MLTVFSGIRNRVKTTLDLIIYENTFIENERLNFLIKRARLIAQKKHRKLKQDAELKFFSPINTKTLPFYYFSKSFKNFNFRSNLIFFNFSSLTKFNFVFFNPFLFKNLFYYLSPICTLSSAASFLISKVTVDFSKLYCYDRSIKSLNNNLISNKTFFHVIQKRLLRTINRIRYKAIATP